MPQSELFSTEIKINISGIEDAIKNIEALRDSMTTAVNDIKSTVKSLNNTKLGNVVAVDSTKVQTELEKIDVSAKKTSQSVANHFARATKQLPDAFIQVESQLKQLPDKSSATVLALSQQFRELRSIAQFEVSQGVGPTPETLGRLDELKTKIGEATLATKQLKDAQQAANITAASDEQKNRVNELIRQSDAVGTVARQASDEIKILGKGGTASFRQITDGIRIATKEGGNFALGLRTALFGVSDSTNIVAKTLDFFGRNLNEVGRLENEFAQAGARASDQIAKLNNGLTTQSRILADIAAAQGTDPVRLNQLRRELDVTTNAFEKVGRNLALGKDATRSLKEAEDSVRRVREQIAFFKATGISTPEQLAELQKLESTLQENENAVKVLTVTNRQLKESLEAAREEEERTEKATKRSAAANREAAEGYERTGRSARGSVDDVDRFNNELGRTSSVAGTVKNALLGAFSGGFLGVAAFEAFNALRFGIAGLGSDIVAVASDAAEMQSKFDTVFKGTFPDGTLVIDQVNQQLELMSVNVKRSITDLKGQAAIFQDTFVPLGFGRDQAAELSIALTAAAQDISSFYNVSTDEAAERLASTLVGNTENMREFGVVINEAAIEAEYLRLGIDANSQSATAQQKAMAILSLSLSGVRDAWGDAVKTGDQFANSQRALEGVVKELKIQLGDQLLPILTPVLGAFTRLAADIGPRLVNTFTQMVAFIQPFSEALVTALDSGNISSLMDLFTQAISDGIDNAISFLNSFIDEAFNWGANFAIEIANGVIETASQVIVEAAEYVGDLFASMWRGESPPEEGPLSDIDKWAKGVVDAYAGGFKAADFSFIEDITQPIKKAFQDIGGEKGFEGFKAVREDVVLLVDELNKTGEIDQGIFGRIKEQLGESNADLAKFLELNLKLQQAQKKLGEIQSEVSAAEQAGFVPEDLRKKLDAAKAEAAQAEENVKLHQEFQKFQSLSLDEFQKASAAAAKGAGSAAAAGSKAVKDAIADQLEFVQTGYAKEKALLDARLAEGSISQQEYYRDLIKLQEKYVVASHEILASNNISDELRLQTQQGLDTQVASLKENQSIYDQILEQNKQSRRTATDKELEFLQSGFDKEKAILEQRRAEGSISQKDYLNELLKLEEKYIQLSHEKGLTAGLDSHVTELGRLQDEIKNLKAAGGENILPDISSIVGEYLDASKALENPVAKAFDNVGQAVTQSFTSAVQTTFKAKIPEIAGQIGGQLQSSFGRVFNQLRDLFSGPQGAIFGGLASIGVGLTLQRLVPIIQRVAASIGPLLSNFRLFLGVALRWSLVGAAVFLVFQNWDKIMAAVNVVTAKAVEIWNQFLENFGGADKLFTDIQTIITDVTTAIQQGFFDIVSIIQGAFQGELGTALQNLLNAIITFDFSSIGTRIQEVFQAIPFEEIGTAITNAVGSIDFTQIETLFTNLWTAIKLTAQEQFGEAGNSIVNLLGPERFQALVTNFENIKLKIQEVFTRGELGGELVNLFTQLKELGIALLPVLSTIAKAVGIALALAIDTAVSLLQGFVDALPFVTSALAGLTRIVSGVVETFTGLIQIVTAVGQAIVAFFTGGDFTAARELLLTGFNNVSSGLVTVFEGIVQTVGSSIAAIVTLITSFVANFINNITIFGNDGAKQFGANIIAWKDTFVTGLNDLVNNTIQMLFGLGDNLKIIMETWPETAGAALVQLSTVVLLHVSNFVASLLTGFDRAKTEIPIIFQDLKDRVILALSQLVLIGIIKANEFFDGFINKMVELGDGVTNALATLVVTGITKTDEFITGIIEKVNGFKAQVNALFISTVIQIVTTLGNLVIGAQNKIQEMIDTVVNAVKSIPGLLLELATDFLSAGAGLVSKFTEGITSGFDKLKGVGQEVTGAVADGAEETRDRFGSAFSTVGGQISSAVSTGTQGALTGFQNLYNQVVGNSIVPDMVVEIGGYFTQMSTVIGGINTGLVTNFQTTGMLIQQSFLTTTILLTQTWLQTMQQIGAISEETFNFIISKVYEFVASITGKDGAVSATNEFISALADIYNDQVEKAFDDLFLDLQELISLLERVQVVAESARSSVNSTAEPTRGNQGLTRGLSQAAATRSQSSKFINGLVTSQQVNRGLSQASRAESSTSINTFNLQAVFPNVTSVDDASALEESLNEIIQRSSALAAVGSF